VPLHDLKVGVWCVISAQRTIQPVLFHETINLQRYVRLILSSIFGQLIGEEKSYGYFMQDNAVVYTENNSIVALDKVFGKRIIS
jgi:hypothetical protein